MNSLHLDSHPKIAPCDAESTLGVENEPDVSIFHPKPTNRALVSAALRLLARRDMSRSEFASKLRKLSSAKSMKASRLPVSAASQRLNLKNECAADVMASSANPSANRIDNRVDNRGAKFNQHDSIDEAEFSADEIEAVADWCAAEGFLNEARFAEGKARSLAGRYGAKRVGATLKQKGVTEDIVAETVSVLKETDLTRARSMWLRKFAEPATNATDRNKQVRYLQSRGFGFDVIKRVINGASDDEDS